MAVMVTLTLQTDVQTYQALHGQLLSAAIPAGMLFHSAHEADGYVAVVDFWPSADAFQEFMAGPAGRHAGKRHRRSRRRQVHDRSQRRQSLSRRRAHN